METGMKLSLESIHAEWSKDAPIDEMALDEESRRTPNLHAKYLRLYSDAKLLVRKHDLAMKTLLKDKWLWYNGKMSKEDIDQKGWAYDPYNGLNKPLKGDMDYWYNSDPEIQTMQMKIDYAKEMQDTLKEIMDNIKWRHQTIKNMIEWRRFISGG